MARQEWTARFGGDTFVLSTTRLDRVVKGQTDSMLRVIANVAEQRPTVRFVFLGWGADADDFRARAAACGSASSVIVLSPVGKRRLIDYYRSCDIVLDQFVYGYYGTSALEAACIGKPVIMKLRADQYAALYGGDVAPVQQAESPADVRQELLALIDRLDLRRKRGDAMREWVVRNHGERRTAPLMLALLRLAADRMRLPLRLDNPLTDPLAADEVEYHQRCHERALAHD